MTKIIRNPFPALTPVPAVLVTCGVPGERPNIIAIAWTGIVCGKPLMMSVSVRPATFSHHLLKEHPEFVINIPTAEMVEVVDFCGSKSGREVDKFAALGLTAAPASQVSVPLIAECPINIECRTQQSLVLGLHEMFIGEVLAVQVDEKILDEKGRVTSARFNPLAYFPPTGEMRGLK